MADPAVLLFTVALPGDNWYAIAKRLGGSQESQAVKNANANYLARANGKGQPSAILYYDEIVWYDPARIIRQPPPPSTQGVVWSPTDLKRVDITKEPWKSAYAFCRTDNKRTATSTRPTTKFFMALDYDDPYTPGSTIPFDDSTNGTSQMTYEDGLASATQALGCAVDPTNADRYRSNAVKILTAYAGVTSIGSGGKERTRLSVAWGASGMTKALWIVDDFPAREQMIENMVEHWFPMMWWTSNSNWWGSFLMVKAGIAALVRDAELLRQVEDEYVAWFLGSTYNRSMDGSLVSPIPSGNQYLTSQWWPNGTVQSDRKATNLLPVQTAEYYRDTTHPGMTRGTFLDAGLTLRNFGIDVFTPLRDRWISVLEFEAQALIDKAISPTGMTQAVGWLTALHIFGADALPTVSKLLTLNPQSEGHSPQRPPTFDSHSGEALVYVLS